MTKDQAEITLIRTILGLTEMHDTVAAVKLLYENGREHLERVRDGRQETKD